MIDRYSLDLWNKLHALLEVHAPDLLQALRPPASDKEIEQAESVLGIKFPSEVLAAYLMHDGSHDSDGDRLLLKTFFPPFHRFLPLDEIVQHWKGWLDMYKNCDYDKELNPNHPHYVACTLEMKIQPVALWDPKWIPLGDSGSTSLVFLDLNPGPSGSYGQLLEHGGVDAPEKSLANNLNDFLETLIKRLDEKMIFYKDGLWYWTKSTERTLIWDDPEAAW
jgi:cell wall assembly regulator SMI1